MENIKINLLEVADIMNRLERLEWNEGTREQECKILDYSILQSVANNTKLLDEIDKALHWNGYCDYYTIKPLLDELSEKDIILGKEEMDKLYLTMRAIVGFTFMSARNLYIDEMGFSKELTDILNNFYRVEREHFQNIARNITIEKLEKVTNGNQELIDEFNAKMEYLGFKWEKRQYDQSPRLYSMYGMKHFDNETEQNYIEIPIEKYIEPALTYQRERVNALEDKLKRVTDKNVTYAPVNKPFKGKMFETLPENMQRWLVKGMTSEAKEEVKELKIADSDRIIKGLIKPVKKLEIAQDEKELVLPKAKTSTLKALESNPEAIYELEEVYIKRNKKALFQMVCAEMAKPNNSVKRIDTLSKVLKHIQEVCEKKKDTNFMK